MARIGFFSLPWSGHLYPMAGLAHELRRRGHQTPFYHLPEFKERLGELGLDIVPYGSLPQGHFAAASEKLSRQEGEQAVMVAAGLSLDLARALLEQPPDTGELDLWVVDQMDYAASTLATARGARFVTAIVTLMKNNEVGVPGFNGRPFDAEEQDLSPLVAPLLAYLDNYRKAAGLEGFSYDALWSRRAQITQQPAEFEFPRHSLPDCFHFTGPFSRPPRPVPFPWEQLDGRPLIYVSFGTAQNRNLDRVHKVLEAVKDLEAQIVLSLGGAEPPPDLPESVLARSYVPQRELLERADLMVTHAGMNSTLEGLSAGVPMLALPIAHDQPGVAARIAWSGAGLRLDWDRTSTRELGQSIDRLLGDPRFKERAGYFKRVIAEGEGLKKAGDLVEAALQGE